MTHHPDAGAWITPEDVRRRVEEIRHVSGDNEAAHGMENRLHRDVLAAIGYETCHNPILCARLALSTREIEFARRCA